MQDFREYSELYHYGILGMKWGVRRYQNKDGSLTEEGKRRKGLSDADAYKEYLQDKGKIDNRYGMASVGTFATATAGGIVGGAVARRMLTAGGPAGLGIYAAIRIGALIAAVPALAMLSRSGDKNIENVKNSYGKKRIEAMEKLCEQKVKNMSRVNIIDFRNKYKKEATKDNTDYFDMINTNKLEKDIISGNISINDLKKRQKQIIKQNTAFYK